MGYRLPETQVALAFKENFCSGYNDLKVTTYSAKKFTSKQSKLSTKSCEEGKPY